MYYWLKIDTESHYIDILSNLHRWSFFSWHNYHVYNIIQKPTQCAQTVSPFPPLWSLHLPTPTTTFNYFGVKIQMCFPQCTHHSLTPYPFPHIQKLANSLWLLSPHISSRTLWISDACHYLGFYFILMFKNYRAFAMPLR